MKEKNMMKRSIRKKDLQHRGNMGKGREEADLC